jgi:hypothetical protein
MRFALAAILLSPALAAAQTCSPVPPGATQLESARYLVVLRTEPERVSVGKHFSLQFSVCPRASGQPLPESVQVDAHMPEHRHGMNYKARVTQASGGRYVADGLLFHMPGRWEILIDARSGDRTDRLVRSLTLQ